MKLIIFLTLSIHCILLFESSSIERSCILFYAFCFIELHCSQLCFHPNVAATDGGLGTYGYFLSGFGTLRIKRQNRQIDVMPVEIPHRDFKSESAFYCHLRADVENCNPPERQTLWRVNILWGNVSSLVCPKKHLKRIAKPLDRIYVNMSDEEESRRRVENFRLYDDSL